ncbi:type II toxin-antitoxin system VapC family toxin [Dolichospermum sp. LEGE 00240]|uniref:type II toxin-antitoxin system VapC family toxin n=1 Tax=Dolichospermum sp. LEGE 00240 TaxID=1828603 RepID=UPI001880D3BE|nr:PIN domain-containing protein [Dolichospermum sp. LEGE 00240]MDM3846367.1 PIN domain-containing protein [Aphanizomenon gracile PMC638.10]MDM3852901.1 PIN domain-containing protein [Aphanizomenon gracile PMC627.10]MDM3857435.1 PIN domain-containing protein [Aphanizomenon gracile PMC649.10]MDM3860922.1 PIN domain-containing protein [Aphanizomenon gracile PMC644.10]MBE9248869.1 type II toxin-antitoxin system VapC family toxin [Dolichospermum sp. LEGE 00240]
MNQERLFLDTVFIQALLNKNDQYHTQAKALLPRVKNAVEVWVTEAVLIEVGNALSAVNRTASVQFINQCYQTDNIKVVSVDTSLLMRALELYHSRQDKNWGLTDCISFIVMQEQGLIYAVTADIHFVQAGFVALLRNPGNN